ncbi:MAG: phage tail tip lysozyme [Polyangiaceae bacterium]
MAHTPGSRILRALPIALLLAGCEGVEAPTSEPVESRSEAIVETADDKIAFDFFLAKGLTPIQSAGIIGNLDQESGMDPTIKQYGGGPGRGIAQWSTGGRWDTTHNANVVWFAGQMGEDKWSLHLQLEFIWWELTNEGYGFNHLKQATTIVQAVTVFQNEYEICGACAQANRIAHAQAAYNQFHNDVVGPVWAAKFVAQSWPYASEAPIQMTQYEPMTGSIDLQNSGTTTWPAGVVKLAPIPRDAASPFAASTWLSPSRVSTLANDVAPGEVGHFEWDLTPAEAGDFQPYFGLVAEGVTWFADSGGPGDDVMQVNVHVAPGTPPVASSTGGAGGGASTGDGGAGGSSATSGDPGEGDPSAEGGDHVGWADEGSTSCAVNAGTRGPSPFGVACGVLGLVGIARRRRGTR